MWTSLSIVAALAAAPQEPTDRDRAVAQVLHDTIRLRRDAGTPSDAEVLRYKQGLADDDVDTYAYLSETSLRDGDGRPWRWLARVQFVPSDWEPDPAAAAKWNERFVGTDEATGARMYFHSVGEGTRRWTYVTARVKRGDTILRLQDARRGGLSEGAHRKAAQGRLEFFVERAEEEKLFDAAEPEIVLSVDGAQYGDGDVVSVDVPLERAAELALEAWIADLELPPADGPRMEWTLETADDVALAPPGGGSVQRMERELVESDPWMQGEVRFRAFDPAPGEPIGQVAVLTIAVPDASPPVLPIRVTLHRTTWIPVLRRFEVVQRLKVRRGLDPEEDLDDDGRVGDDVDPLAAAVARGWELDEYRVHASSLAAAWTELAHEARIRPSLEADAPGGVVSPGGEPFGADEPVLLGWRVDPRTLNDFAVADVAPFEPSSLGAWTTRVPLDVVVDLWIARDPTPAGTTYLDSLGGDLLGDLSAEEDGAASSEEREVDLDPDRDGLGPDGLPVDPFLRDQHVVRESILLEDYAFTLARVTDEGVEVPEGRKLGDLSDAEREAYARRLSHALRRPAGRATEPDGTQRDDVRPIAMPPALLRRLTEYDEFALLDRRPFRIQIRTPGVYELRLRLGFQRMNTSERRRLDVAIRLNVTGQDFASQKIDWRTRTAR